MQSHATVLVISFFVALSAAKKSVIGTTDKPCFAICDKTQWRRNNMPMKLLFMRTKTECPFTVDCSHFSASSIPAKMSECSSTHADTITCDFSVDGENGRDYLRGLQVHPLSFDMLVSGKLRRKDHVEILSTDWGELDGIREKGGGVACGCGRSGLARKRFPVGGRRFGFIGGRRSARNQPQFGAPGKEVPENAGKLEATGWIMPKTREPPQEDQKHAPQRHEETTAGPEISQNTRGTINPVVDIPKKFIKAVGSAKQVEIPEISPKIPRTSQGAGMEFSPRTPDRTIESATTVKGGTISEDWRITATTNSPLQGKFPLITEKMSGDFGTTERTSEVTIPAEKRPKIPEIKTPEVSFGSPDEVQGSETTRDSRTPEKKVEFTTASVKQDTLGVPSEGPYVFQDLSSTTEPPAKVKKTSEDPRTPETVTKSASPPVEQKPIAEKPQKMPKIKTPEVSSEKPPVKPPAEDEETAKDPRMHTAEPSVQEPISGPQEVPTETSQEFQDTDHSSPPPEFEKTTGGPESPETTAAYTPTAQKIVEPPVKPEDTSENSSPAVEKPGTLQEVGNSDAIQDFELPREFEKPETSVDSVENEDFQGQKFPERRPKSKKIPRHSPKTKKPNGYARPPVAVASPDDSADPYLESELLDPRAVEKPETLVDSVDIEDFQVHKYPEWRPKAKKTPRHPPITEKPAGNVRPPVAVISPDDFVFAYSDPDMESELLDPRAVEKPETLVDSVDNEDFQVHKYPGWRPKSKKIPKTGKPAGHVRHPVAVISPDDFAFAYSDPDMESELLDPRAVEKSKISVDSVETEDFQGQKFPERRPKPKKIPRQPPKNEKPNGHARPPAVVASPDDIAFAYSNPDLESELLDPRPVAKPETSVDSVETEDFQVHKYPEWRPKSKQIPRHPPKTAKPTGYVRPPVAVTSPDGFAFAYSNPDLESEFLDPRELENPETSVDSVETGDFPGPEFPGWLPKSKKIPRQSSKTEKPSVLGRPPVAEASPDGFAFAYSDPGIPDDPTLDFSPLDFVTQFQRRSNPPTKLKNSRVYHVRIEY